MSFIGLFFKKPITAEECKAKLQDHKTKLEAQATILDTEIEALEREMDDQARKSGVRVDYNDDPEMQIKCAKHFALSEAIKKVVFFTASYGTSAHESTYNDLKAFLEEALASGNVIAGSPLNRTQNLLRPLLADVLTMGSPIASASPSPAATEGATAAGAGGITTDDVALEMDGPLG